MNDPLAADADATCIARSVRERRVTAAAVVETTLERIRRVDGRLNAFTALCAQRARSAAKRLDARLAEGAPVGALAGVPFAAKAHIAVAGLMTTAGSRLHAGDPPAARDADAVLELERAGAICVGVTNMDEFGMGGTTENLLFGPTRNPHDTSRTPGGSSGGSAAAVAGGLVPIALGSDALGSVRLPASLCGVYGLRPTCGAISGAGLLPSPDAITTIGPLARTVADLAECFAAASGPKRPGHDAGGLQRRRSDAGGERPGAAGDALDVVSLRVGVAGGYFAANRSSDAADAVAVAAKAFPAAIDVEFPEPVRARAAAVLINASESAGAQLDRLRRDPDAFDPLTRDRFLAHALLPAAWYFRARLFVRWHRHEVLRLLDRCPVLLLPATPCVAPPIGTRTLRIDGVEQPTGPSLGLYTQPLAALGCPVLTVPIARPGFLPIGVQLLARPGNEALLFAAADRLEALGVAAAPIGVAGAPVGHRSARP